MQYFIIAVSISPLLTVMDVMIITYFGDLTDFLTRTLSPGLNANFGSLTPPTSSIAE